jgi:hypothetical protein
MKTEVNVPGGISGRTLKSTSQPNEWNWLNIDRGTDRLFFGGDSVNRGIWSDGDREVGIYTGGQKRFAVDRWGTVSAQRGIQVTNSDPGPLIEKNYGRNADRYGVGQFPFGTMRMYTASSFTPATVNLSVAKDDGGFDDYLKIHTNGHTKIGGSFGANKPVQISEHTWMPFSDGNTYIRPGRDRGTIHIGDWFANEVNLGKSDTPVNVKGNLNVQGPGTFCINNTCLTEADLRKIKALP